MVLVPDEESWPPGLCCCPMLKLYASSSLDCTIRIWTTENHLLRLAGGGGWGWARDGGLGFLGASSGFPTSAPDQSPAAEQGREGLASVSGSLEQGQTFALDPLQAPAAERRPSGPDLLQQQWGLGTGTGLSPLPGISPALPAHILPG